jgi:hypothetical protein
MRTCLVRATVYQTFSNLIVSVSGSWIEIHSSAAQVCVTPCKHAVIELPHTADYVFGPGGRVAERTMDFFAHHGNKTLDHGMP